MRIGVESWAYHRRFGSLYPWEGPTSEPPLDAPGFLHHVASLGIRDASLQTLFLPDITEATADRLRQPITQHDLRVVLAWGHPDGLCGGTRPDRLDALRGALAFAASLDLTTVRVVCGDAANWGEPFADRMVRLVPMLQAAAAEASEAGLRLAIENHGDLRMAELVHLVEAVGLDALGICLDNGNCLRAGDDPAAAAALAAPYVQIVHLKDVLDTGFAGFPSRPWTTVPLGRGVSDPGATLDVLEGVAETVFVELSAMHPDFPDTDAAVREGLRFLHDREASVRSMASCAELPRAGDA